MISRPPSDSNIVSISTADINGTLVLNVLDNLTIYSKFDTLTSHVKEALEKGVKSIAVSFTKESYLNTKLISNLVQYWKLAQDKGATFGLIRPNEDILNALTTIGLADLIVIYEDEDEVGRST